MPSVTKSQAIVLHLTRQGDSGAVLHVIDSLAGRQGVYVRGLGKARGASASAFHSLALLDIVTYAVPKSSLLYLREYEPIVTMDGIRTDISKSTTALFISEVLYRSLKSDDGDTELWKWLAQSIVKLDSATGSVANFHLWWMTGYCIKAGFRPNDNWSENAHLFDIVTAQFISPKDGILRDERQIFSSEESLLLHLMLNSDADKALTLPLRGSLRLSFARRMLDYLSYRFGCDLNVKSLDVLHEIFK